MCKRLLVQIVFAMFCPSSVVTSSACPEYLHEKEEQRMSGLVFVGVQGVGVMCQAWQGQTGIDLAFFSQAPHILFFFGGMFVGFFLFACQQRVN